MLSREIKAELSLLRRGSLGVDPPPALSELSAKAFIADLKESHPYVFQERQVRGKYEIGLARRVAYELEFHAIPGSQFPGVEMRPQLSRCFLISAYDDEISEITWLTRLRIRPIQGTKPRIGLSFGPGSKLDRTVDGWVLNPLKKRETILAENSLSRHGWQFHVLPPFGMTARVP